jgi:hypothetical protein
VCAHLQYFAHRIHYSTLWSSEKRLVQNAQSASCSSSSSVESSARGTASLVSQSDGVSDGVGFRQTLSSVFLDLVVCLIFSFWVASKYFLKVNSLFSFLFHHEDLDLVQAWHRADIWWSESISRSERQKIRRTEWWLIAGLCQSRMVHMSSICVPWRQREIVWSEHVHVTREKACRPAAISRCSACRSLLVFSEQFANLVNGDESPWVWTEPVLNFLAIECFRVPHESFIQGLHFVAAVRWKVNYENCGRLVAPHFLAAHSLNSCLHPSGSHSSFEPSVILYNPEGIIHKILTS